jgi:hypothetical protein
LDEPAAHQSDRTILEMQLRATSKKGEEGEKRKRRDAHTSYHSVCFTPALLLLYSYIG